MQYHMWHKQTIQQLKPASDWQQYFRVGLFGLVFFGLSYGYTSWLKTPNPLNKAVADTSIFLMGLSMLLSSICYFWDRFDTKIIYRKHLGLIGYAFAIAHVVLSHSALRRLIFAPNWSESAPWAVLTGLLATGIFTIMAAISNRYMAKELGGRVWRTILRTGYLAVILVWFHVVLLKSSYWMKWYQGGMKTLPSMSLLVSLFMVVVVVMRIRLWWALRSKQKA